MKKYEDVTQYQGQVEAASADFPHGAPIDSPTPGLGTPYTAATEKVHQALIQKLFAVAGVTPNGLDDTATNSQLYDVLQSVVNDFDNATNRTASRMSVAALPSLGLSAGDLQSILGSLQNGAVNTKQSSTQDQTAGRLLINGAHGLGGDAVTVSSFDTIQRGGLFYGPNGTAGEPPESGAHYVIATGSGSNSTMIAFNVDSGNMYARVKIGGSGGWRKLADDRTDVGKLQWFATNTTPEGYLRPNGAAVSRFLYGDLFAVIGTQYGSGDGSTTFNLPDLRGEFLRAFDDGRGVDSGRVFGSSQADEFASHVHPQRGSVVTTGAFTGYQMDLDNTNATVAMNISTDAAGGDETRPRNVAMGLYIKY